MIDYDKLDRNVRNAMIREIVKSQAPTVSVRGGRGTVYTWTEILGSGPGYMFTPQEKKGLASLGIGVRRKGQVFTSSNMESLPWKKATEFLKKYGKYSKKKHKAKTEASPLKGLTHHEYLSKEKMEKAIEFYKKQGTEFKIFNPKEYWVLESPYGTGGWIKRKRRIRKGMKKQLVYKIGVKHPWKQR